MLETSNSKWLYAIKTKIENNNHNQNLEFSEKHTTAKERYAHLLTPS